TRVASLDLAGSQSQDDLQVVPLRPGDILTPQNVRASIQALYDTGHYSYVEADANLQADGRTALTFRVRSIFFFSTFRIEPENLLERSLSNYFRLPIGEKFTTSAVNRVVQDTKDLLMSEGYFQAAVTPSYESEEETHLIFVTLKTAPGIK